MSRELKVIPLLAKNIKVMGAIFSVETGKLAPVI